MTEPWTVDDELRADRMLYGTCFWRVVGGKKIRIPPHEIMIGSDGALIAPHIEGELFSEDNDSSSWHSLER